MKVVVVESPSKAKTINKYLGPGYEVLASFGHIRDLPAKDGSVDPDNNFKMLWEVDPQSQKRVNDIAHALKKADTLILATDPDREGEAISWHVLEALNEKKALKDQTVERVVFNAITKQSVTEAMKHPREIDKALVDAYLARRALDYLVGFTLSPVLVAQAARRTLGRPRAVGGAAAGLRPRTGNREIRRQGILVDPRQAEDAARRKLRGASGRRRRAEAAAARHRLGASRPTISRTRSKARPSPSPMSRQSRRGAIRRRLSPPRPCSRKRPASSALRRRSPCGWRSASTKASRSTARPPASSPICAPTASTSRRRRSPISAPCSARITARNTCRPRRANITTSRRTRRKPTKRSARPPPRARRPKSQSTSTAIRPASTN